MINIEYSRANLISKLKVGDTFTLKDDSKEIFIKIDETRIKTDNYDYKINAFSVNTSKLVYILDEEVREVEFLLTELT